MLVISSLFIVVYQILYIHIQNIRYLKQHLQAGLPPVTNIRIDHAEALAKFLCQPSLLFCLQRYKISCYKKRKEEEKLSLFAQIHSNAVLSDVDCSQWCGIAVIIEPIVCGWL